MTGMKTFGFLAGLALLAALPSAVAMRTDDPPPHPTSCPLCGGDPQVHVQKTFQVGFVAARAAGLALRW
jgi:hypothetical protein